MRPYLFALLVKTRLKSHSPSQLESHSKVASDLDASWTLACWLRWQERENVLQPLGSLQFSFALLIRRRGRRVAAAAAFPQAWL